MTGKQEIPKILHCVWLGDSPKPPEVVAWLDTWRRYCPGWELREWGSDFARACAIFSAALRYGFASE